MLGGIFIASLVACNLIFQKFFTLTPFGLYTFEISVGILPYPVTFLVTDIISEVYGRKKADRVVFAGLLASLFTLAVVMLADSVQATEWSPVDNSQFTSVFGLTGSAVGASMLAYLTAQFIDVRLFHFWKRLTKGRYLWLRNNFSTFTSQLVDTATVLLFLCFAGAIEWSLFFILFLNGFLFKVLVAVFDTPLLYLFTWLFRRHFGLKGAEEIIIP